MKNKNAHLLEINQNYKEKYGFSYPEESVYKTEKGLREKIVREISTIKKEPQWMLEKRLQGLKWFNAKLLPTWGGDLTQINFDEITYYLKPTAGEGRTWDEVPDNIKKTFDKLGIPEAERKFLGGAAAQYESEVIYHKIRDNLARQGVAFLSMDDAVHKHPELVKKYFSTVVPASDNKFAALNTACWSGGSFIHVPKNIKVEIPLQAYFRINTKNFGQFERTLIIADEGSEVTYVEGCSAPIYSTDSLHAAVVELIALKNAKLRYTTIQNWSPNVYNLVTKRAHAYENALVEWVDFNIGCLTGDTKIFLNNDIKNIRDIEPNDVVFALNEDFVLERKRVIAKTYSGNKLTFKIRTLNHREVTATENHPFLTINKIGNQNTISWTPLNEIKAGDLVAISGVIPDYGRPHKINFTQRSGKRAPKPIAIPTESTEKLMWLLGFYLGDGFVEKNRACFAVPPEDKSQKTVVEILKTVFKVRPIPYKQIIRVNSATLVELIKYFGLAGNARTKRIPPWVYTLPNTQKRAFIEGYIAADGHIRKGHKNISITSCSKELLEEVKMLAVSCGLNPLKISRWTSTVKKPLGKESKEYTHFFLYFSEKEMQKPVQFVPVTEISPAGHTDTYDIEVEGAHNFVANGFIVHNSKLTMKYPSIYLLEPRAKGDILSIAFAGKNQHQDSGGKAIHLAPDTTSRVIAKSIAKDGGRTSYRGLVHIAKGAVNSTSSVKCDALLLDEKSRSDTYPTMKINEEDSTTSHEAYVGKIGEEQLFYLKSRGFSENEATAMIVLGFLADVTKELPMEYAMELNNLIKLEMEGGVG